MIKALICDLHNVLIRSEMTAAAGWDAVFAFDGQVFVNTELLAALMKLPLKLCILTNMSSNVGDPLLVNEIERYFEDKGFEFYQAARLGLDKSVSYTYEFIAKNKLGLLTSEVAFIDNLERNITAANNEGLVTLLYNSKINTAKANSEVENWLKTLIVS